MTKITVWALISPKHRVIGIINLSLRTFTTVTMMCYNDFLSLDQFRYEADLPKYILGRLLSR